MPQFKIIILDNFYHGGLEIIYLKKYSIEQLGFD
jgi:hypothetical protein